MRLAGRLAWAAILATVVLVVLLGIPKLSTSRALAIWIVVVAAFLLVVLIRHSRAVDEWHPSRRFESALRDRKSATPPPEELLRMERELVLGSADADHAHRRLLPLLRTAASARISARHGFELERRPDAARALLGADAWELLRPDRPEPADRHDAGIPQAQIAAVIARIEAL
ncbi:MAG TPA: hypothetical protein VGH46_12240 [Gaiellaceae bacterium]|jgi:hypothetical protein